MTKDTRNMDHSSEKNIKKELNVDKETIDPAAQTQPDADADTSSKAGRKSKKDKTDRKAEELGQRLAELTDRHLRLQAEFDNFRKRTLKEKAELVRTGGESVLTSILPIIDDFDRALTTMSEVPEDDPAKIGFLLIFNKFKEFLKSNQVLEIEAIGQDFDVDLHDAITKIPAPSKEMKGKVVDVVQKGYLLNSKVIRYAKVVIGD